MTSKHFYSLALIGLGLAAAGLGQIGCSSSSGSTPATGGSATTTTSSHSSSAGHTVSASSSGAGGGSGGSGGGATTGHDPSSAVSVMLDASPATTGTLVDTKTPDYYTFTTTVASDRLFIGVFATGLPSGQLYNASVITPTFALFDSAANAMTNKQLTYVGASNPNQGQNAEVYVEIATPGTYYIKIEDCIGMFGASSCPNPASGITSFDYGLVISHPAKLNLLEVNADPTKQNGMTSGAQTIAYKVPTMGTAGDYGEIVIDGNFKSATDTHVFSFTPPADTKNPSAGGTNRAEFYVQPINGSGMMDEGGDLSDANIKIWVTDSTGAIVLSSDDQNNYVNFTPLNFSLPVTLGTQYFLWVKNTQASGSSAKDFYFIRHFYDDLIDVAELEGPTVGGVNDTPATAEVLAAQGSAKSLFTVDGHIAKAGTGAWPASDTDWFKFTIPAKVTQGYALQCDSARSGSGLVGFTAQLFQSDGTTMITTATESATMDISAPNYIALPSGVSSGQSMYLQITAASQDATDTGTQYRCYVFFN